MGSVSAYITSVASVCLCCAIFHKLIGQKGANASVISSLCGVILAIAVISPVIKINLSGIEDYINDIQIETSHYVNAGEKASQNELRSVITEKVNAYILEKASSYDCDIKTVEVSVTSDSIPVPDSVVINGTYSPYIKNQLSGLIASNLGISKEKQQWIYQN